MNTTDRKRGRVCPVAWAGSLDNGVRRWLQNPRKILGPHVREGMVVLDAGCGPGFFTIPLAEMVGNSGCVIAADLQEGMLRKVADKMAGTELEERIILHPCSEAGLGVLERVDFVLLFYMVHEVSDPASLWRDLAKALKPEGRILVVEPPFHVSKKAFRAALDEARDVGLHTTETPRLFPNRTAVLGMAPIGAEV